MKEDGRTERRWGFMGCFFYLRKERAKHYSRRLRNRCWGFRRKERDERYFDFGLRIEGTKYMEDNKKLLVGELTRDLCPSWVGTVPSLWHLNICYKSDWTLTRRTVTIATSKLICYKHLSLASFLGQDFPTIGSDTTCLVSYGMIWRCFAALQPRMSGDHQRVFSNLKLDAGISSSETD